MINKEQAEINTWWDKVHSIANGWKICLGCERSARLDPSIVWVPETLRCIRCHKEKIKNYGK